MREGENSKISEKDFFGKEITHHIFSMCEHMCVSDTRTESRLHIDEIVDIRRQYFFILPGERQHSPMPVETNWDLRYALCLSISH